MTVFSSLCVSFINRKRIYRMIVTVTCHIDYCLRLSRKTPSFVVVVVVSIIVGFVLCSLFVFLLYDPRFEKKKKEDLRFTQTPISSSQNREENVSSSLCDKRKWFFKSLESCVAFVQNFKVAPPWRFVISHNECDVSERQEETHMSNVLTKVSPTLTSISQVLRNLYISVDWLCDHMKDRWR